MIPVNEPLLDGNELAYLKECITTGWISSEGPYVKRFEKSLSKFVGRKDGVAVINGTAALHLAFASLNLPAGSEVVVPAFTIISCVSSFRELGLIPVPVDCDPFTFNMTVSGVFNAITEKTRAILVVHIYGLPVDLDPILELARHNNIKVIEDAAEAIGQTYNGRQCGSFGDLSIFSFYPNKHITTGEGGMLLTDNKGLADRSRWLRNLAFDAERRYIHEELGWNFRMTNMQAAIGCAQLENISRNITLKRRIGKAYNDALRSIKNIQLPVEKTDYAENIYWVYPIVISDDVAFEARQVMQELGRAGIGTRHFFYPLHRQPALLRHYPQLSKLNLPVSDKLAKKGFYIPSGLGLSLDLIPSIAERIADVFEKL